MTDLLATICTLPKTSNEKELKVIANLCTLSCEIATSGFRCTLANVFFSLFKLNYGSPGSTKSTSPPPGGPYPPNHPLSGSKHFCSICGDRASGKQHFMSFYRLTVTPEVCFLRVTKSIQRSNTKVGTQAAT